MQRYFRELREKNVAPTIDKVVDRFDDATPGVIQSMKALLDHLGLFWRFFRKFRELRQKKASPTIDEIVGGFEDVSPEAKATMKILLGFYVRENLPLNQQRPFRKFIRYVAKFNKSYKDEATAKRRFQNYLKNLEKIRKNRRHSRMYGLTQFSDLSEEEFRRGYGGLILDDMTKNLTRTINDSAHLRGGIENGTIITIPTHYDIRALKCTPPIKDQGGCGACWAFSSLAVTEINHCLKTGQTYDLSEQEMISCTVTNATSPYVSHQCNGGSPYPALDYIYQNGVTTADIFPYVGNDNLNNPAPCHQDGYRFRMVNKPHGSKNVIPEKVLPAYVYQNGAYSVAICQDLLQNLKYQGGIIMESHIIPSDKCSQGQLDHAVTVVGYGHENGVNYWIILNSWGPDWGEAGYFRLQREKGLLNFKVFDYTY
uniref:Papain family cysteine protease n=1 Tax=Bursaphelenchus xylophilus TaxID=6326 RepID=A0A1I7RJK7_BURXY